MISDSTLYYSWPGESLREGNSSLSFGQEGVDCLTERKAGAGGKSDSVEL